jgi:glycosyltransferase involved in cell wall biosynthesis
MIILHVVSSSGMYGAEAVILNLCRSMNSGSKCCLVTFYNLGNPNQELYKRARAEGIETYELFCASQFDRRAFDSLRTVVERTHADVVHAHGYKADIYAYRALRGTSIPLVSTCHTWYDNDLMVYLYGLLDRLVLRRYTSVVGVSDEVIEKLRKAGVKDIQLVRNGIDLRRFMPKALSRSAKTVGLVGRLAPEKGVDVFLRAATLVLPRFPYVRFVVAGDGPDRAVLERLIDELGIRENVTLLGRCEDMAEFYQSLDLMVSSSRQEGLRIAILEGMASGLPIIAASVGEVPTIIHDGETGVLLRHCCPEELASAITNLLLDSGTRRNLGATARRLVEKEYSTERMTNDYLRVYEAALVH